MTSGAIQNAWGQLRSSEDMAHLADAAKCRSESDWLVGLNSTRALTCFRSRHGGFNITAAGRVQTPTLAILAQREREIKAFEPRDYWEVQADFAVTRGNYEGRWFDPEFTKSEEEPEGRAERIWNETDAQAIADRCAGKSGTIEEEKKPTKQSVPLLYDLTTLQREAPFTAKNTLAIAQALYERHKMITYPRTDSRYLPEDYLGNVLQTTQEVAQSSHPAATWAAKSLEEDKIRFNKRIFNNAKVSDHFAIIPTGRVVKLSDAEAKLYDMIVKRFIAVFYPPAEFEVTKRITTIDHGDLQDQFLTRGKTLVQPGWLAVYGRQAGVTNGKDELVAIESGESATVDAITAEGKTTTPPARYTESTLLSAMEGAGKLIEDEDLREAMSERGLGTPATRAATIEGLLRQKYIARDGRDLNVTGKGLRLIELCEEMKIEALTSPSMTGDWEAKLNKMQQGQIHRDTFMREISTFTEDVVNKARAHLQLAQNRSFPDLEAPCPACGAARLQQTDATYECRDMDCTFKISKYIAGRELNTKEAARLMIDKALPEMEGFRSRFNKPFSAGLKLEQPIGKNGKPLKWKIDFVFDDADGEDVELGEDEFIKDLSLQSGLAAKLYATEKAFHVPAFRPKESPEGFRLGKTILQKELETKDVEALLTAGKTAQIEGFVSKRTKRAFKAALTLDFETGKIGFEFEPRPKKKAPKKKSS